MNPDNEFVAPADFYTGVVAEMYRHLRSETFDPAPYARFVERWGEPALELGCGDGDPILDLVAGGLDVEGLDSSADMLDRCRLAAIDRGLDVTLHLATFEAMDLGKRYRSIYLAGATFNLLPDDAAAEAALARIAAHLEPNGAAIVSLFIPPPRVASDAGAVREHVMPDGVVMRLTVLGVDRDESARTQSTLMRYEVLDGGERRVAERNWTLHWIEQETFAAMAERAGLFVRGVYTESGVPAEPSDTDFTFVLQPRRAG